MDDEDKGSPSQDGVNLARTPALPMGEGYPKDRVRVKKKSKVQRKPFGCAITRYLFPLKNQFCNNTVWAING